MFLDIRDTSKYLLPAGLIKAVLLMNESEFSEKTHKSGSDPVSDVNQQPPGTASQDETLRQSPEERAQTAHLSKDRGSFPAKVPGYEMIRSLGEGSYGSVWLAQEENTGKYVAIKFYTHRRGLDWSPPSGGAWPGAAVCMAWISSPYPQPGRKSCGSRPGAAWWAWFVSP